MAVSAEAQKLSLRVQCNLVADEIVGADSRLAHADHQASVSAVSIREPNLDADPAVGERRRFVDELRAGATADMEFAIRHGPHAVVGSKPFHGRRATNVVSANRHGERMSPFRRGDGEKCEPHGHTATPSSRSRELRQRLHLLPSQFHSLDRHSRSEHFADPTSS